MKNKILISLLIFFINLNSVAEEVFIEAKKISLDKDDSTSVFEDKVKVTTNNKTITSEYAKYNKTKGLIILKKNVVAIDELNNVIKTDYAEYHERDKFFISRGATQIITSDNYKLEGSDIIADNNKKIIKSNQNSTLRDEDDNIIYLSNFEYNGSTNIFKSVGLIKIKDKLSNIYEFSQIYVDTKRKEIVGTDTKAFLNDENIKINKENNPRIFSNASKITSNKSSFNKSIFTLCKYRKNDKCPPWVIQSKKMLHDNKKKTIYYENAIIKVYNVPIFFFPRLSHPDPTVSRRSGFLPPTLYDTKNLGTGISLPYFFNLGLDKNFTLTNRLYATENPLFMGEYHQAFKNSKLLADFGYTEGYKKTSSTKKMGEKSHFFSKFSSYFKGKNNSENTLNLSLQDVSNDKYLKLYKIKSNLVDYNNEILENELSFTSEIDDLFFGFTASVYETLNENYEDKYEYILPEITFDKSLLNSQKYGSLSLQSNYKVHNYDTNKLTNFLINDFSWNSKDFLFKNGINTKLLGNLKNINYETKNIDLYKKDLTNELYGAIGLLTELNFQKNQNNSKHFFTPKMLIRFSPGQMREEKQGNRLNPGKAFSLNRISNINNYETGLSGTYGFDYKIKNDLSNFNFSLAQVINEKENKKMADKTSLNEKLSDIVGSASLGLNRYNINYNFSVDQNFNEYNYNELGLKTNFDNLNFDVNYLRENNHIGDQDYIKSGVSYNKNSNAVSFEAKRNLITNSAEFYNLSYEYMNDCLRAGLVYRREFYNDSEIEPENSLMFKITLVPFGNINSPKFSK
jgi:LPS-assembly protein